MSTRGGRSSMREGPLSELFRNTDPASRPMDREPELESERRPPSDGTNYVAVIRVVGVGGAGCNAVNRMIEAGLRGVEFVAINTDRQALEESEADVRIPVGMELTRGRGEAAVPTSRLECAQAVQGMQSSHAPTPTLGWAETDLIDFA